MMASSAQQWHQPDRTRIMMGDDGPALIRLWRERLRLRQLVCHPRLDVAFLKRTPTPPPFSSMNSMPASSSARRIAMSFAGINDVTPSVSSARRIVVTPTKENRARSSALQRIRERAARI